MASVDDVKKLAALARIEVKDEELSKFAQDFEGVLAYVSQLESLSVEGTKSPLPPVRNRMREDGEPHEGGVYTDALTAQFPAKEGKYLSVKKIISHD